MKWELNLVNVGLNLSLPSRERGLKSHMKSMCIAQTIVAPLAGAWIEIVVEPTTPGSTITVAPLAGAWIEICIFDGDNNPYSVAPLAGAWIEIENGGIEHGKSKVAPLAGAWIEI